MSDEEYTDDFIAEILESRGIGTVVSERNEEEQEFFRRLARPSDGWLHQVNLYEGSSALMDTEFGTYRVTVDEVEQ